MTAPLVIDVAAIAAQVLAAPEVAREELTVDELADRTPAVAALRIERQRIYGTLGIFEELYEVEVVRVDPNNPRAGWIATARDRRGADVTEKGATRFATVRALWQTILEGVAVQGVAA